MKRQGGKMLKYWVVFCWGWIGIWLVYKVIEILSGNILDALDFSNPSLAGIIAVFCIVSLVINRSSDAKDKEINLTIKHEEADRMRNIDKEEMMIEVLEGVWRCPACKVGNLANCDSCDECGQRVKIE